MLWISDEDIGTSLKTYINTAVEQVMENFSEKGLVNEEIEDLQDYIETWVLNEAQDALEYYFEGSEISKITEELNYNNGFGKKLDTKRDSMVEDMVQKLVPEEKINNYKEYYIVEDIISAKLPFTADNMANMIKEKYKLE